MAIKPILFNTEMVRAILDGRKTVTRRLVKFLSRKNPNWTGYVKDGLMLYNGRNEPCIKKAPYQPGDILYVRESYSELSFGYVYKADGENIDHLGNVIKWHPSIHMPKEAARIWLKVTDVRVERLQDMWASDVSKEGLLFNKPTTVDEMLLAFAKLWNSAIKKSDIDSYGWNANPWVWVIEFERCEKPEGEF
jgi:hypothetical protein